LEPRALIVNGVEVSPQSEIGPGERLLDVLRDRLGLTGTKEGCGRGECGACTVLVGGAPVLSCITLADRVRAPVETIEGIGEEASELAGAFADTGGFQCGFCTPGQIVRGVSLLRQGLPATDGELRRAMSGNVCRCTGYNGIIDALRLAEAQRGGAE
jgi:aerobic-type carbon monoxide dehydrogenase small subunit (CoxS/CutS family)